MRKIFEMKRVAAMRKGRNWILATVVVLMSVTMGCDHVTDPFDGPSLVDRFGEFELLEPLMASSETVDFSSGATVYFTARFNKNLPFVPADHRSGIWCG